VTVDIPIEDLPGPPVTSVECDSCGESVKDRREVVMDGKTLCRSCAGDSYYEV
jgi:formylmethanofuran dehydrogenase subunit E